MKYLSFLLAVTAMLPLQLSIRAQQSLVVPLPISNKQPSPISNTAFAEPDFVLIQTAAPHRASLLVTTADPTPGPSDYFQRPPVLHPMSFDGFDTATDGAYSLHRIAYYVPVGNPKLGLVAGFDTQLVWHKEPDGFYWRRNHQRHLSKSYQYLSEPVGYAANFRISKALLPGLQFSMTMQNVERPHFANDHTPMTAQLGLQWARNISRTFMAEAEIQQSTGQTWTLIGGYWRMSPSLRFQMLWNQGRPLLGMGINFSRSSSVGLSYFRRQSYLNFYSTF